ncbi:unnamed protein product, partial [Ascophyllum nodosum]
MCCVSTIFSAVQYRERPSARTLAFFPPSSAIACSPSEESLERVLEPCFCCYHLDAKNDQYAQGLLETRLAGVPPSVVRLEAENAFVHRLHHRCKQRGHRAASMNKRLSPARHESKDLSDVG